MNREEQKKKAVELYKQNLKQAEIASILGVQQGTISKWLTEVEKDWKQQNRETLDELRREQLDMLQNVQKIAYESYLETQDQKEARLLVETSKRICSLMGLNMPVKHEVENTSNLNHRIIMCFPDNHRTLETEVIDIPATPALSPGSDIPADYSEWE